MDGTVGALLGVACGINNKTTVPRIRYNQVPNE